VSARPPRFAGPLLIALALAAPSGVGAAPYRQPVNGDVLVSAYFDHGGVRDWACTDWTYGGHRGTDIAIIGRFAAQDEGRDITAAQAGRVTRTHDGEFDRCTTADCAGGNGFGNYVYVEHADGHVTIYAHMRQGSVRVAEGQQVGCGDVIGQVGSSGYSTGPHVHFEVRVGGNADDPFSGQCGGPLSYWVAQGDHRGLPTRDCAGGEPPPPPPPPPERPDIHLALSFEPPGDAPRACDFDDCRDFVRDGTSGGLFDAWLGETFSVHVVVSNQGNGTTQGESPEDSAITLQYELPAGLAPVGYDIQTDWPAKDRASWQPNDAMQNPANPPADAPPGAGELRLNGFSAGESKRVTLRVRATESSVASGAHRPVRAWIKHLRGYYGEKTGWDDPAEVNDGQTYNGGDLKAGGELDVFDPTAFLFESPDAAMVEGWRRCAPDAVAGFTVNPADHALSSEIVGPGPCIEGPRVAVPLAGYAGLRLVARQHQTRRSGRVQWTTEALPEFSDARSVEFHTDWRRSLRRAAPRDALGPRRHADPAAAPPGRRRGQRQPLVRRRGDPPHRRRADAAGSGAFGGGRGSWGPGRRGRGSVSARRTRSGRRRAAPGCGHRRRRRVHRGAGPGRSPGPFGGRRLRRRLLGVGTRSGPAGRAHRDAPLRIAPAQAARAFGTPPRARTSGVATELRADGRGQVLHLVEHEPEVAGIDLGRFAPDVFAGPHAQLARFAVAVEPGAPLGELGITDGVDAALLRQTFLEVDGDEAGLDHRPQEFARGLCIRRGRVGVVQGEAIVFARFGQLAAPQRPVVPLHEDVGINHPRGVDAGVEAVPRELRVEQRSVVGRSVVPAEHGRRAFENRAGQVQRQPRADDGEAGFVGHVRVADAMHGRRPRRDGHAGVDQHAVQTQTAPGLKVRGAELDDAVVGHARAGRFGVEDQDACGPEVRFGGHSVSRVRAVTHARNT
jgi:murein DD-endopeptidase MepM/ murein hydrolase activator NlpD